MDGGAAQAWFTAGTLVFVVAGGAHALLTLVDTVRPIAFTPNDPAVRPEMERTGFRFRRPFPGGDDKPSMWTLWLGFNASHGLGAFSFGLACLLIASHDFALIGSVGGLRPLTIAVAAAYCAIALRYWFWAIALMTAGATACFAISALLA